MEIDAARHSAEPTNLPDSFAPLVDAQPYRYPGISNRKTGLLVSGPLRHKARRALREAHEAN